MTVRIIQGLVAALLTLATLATDHPAWAGPLSDSGERIQFVGDTVEGDQAEDISMVANDRAQFNKIIQVSGYRPLVTKPTAKQDEGLEADRELTIRKASQTK